MEALENFGSAFNDKEFTSRERKALKRQFTAQILARIMTNTESGRETFEGLAKHLNHGANKRLLAHEQRAFEECKKELAGYRKTIDYLFTYFVERRNPEAPE